LSSTADLVGHPTNVAQAKVFMDHDGSAENALGRIPLKQVRVKRTEAGRTSPVNLLVPYLDLFSRLDDEELGRLAAVDAEVVCGLRKQVTEVERALARYTDLLPRLTDAELVRLTGATEKTIRFWRLCQPRKRERVDEETSSSQAVVGHEPSAPEPVKVDRAAKTKTNTRILGDKAGARTTPSRESAPACDRPDSRITINPAAQATVDAMMTFSGAPFPGYDDDGEPRRPPPPDEISLAEAEAAD
jgi:hypothetical protein